MTSLLHLPSTESVTMTAMGPHAIPILPLMPTCLPPIHSRASSLHATPTSSPRGSLGGLDSLLMLPTPPVSPQRMAITPARSPTQSDSEHAINGGPSILFSRGPSATSSPRCDDGSSLSVPRFAFSFSNFAGALDAHTASSAHTSTLTLPTHSRNNSSSQTSNSSGGAGFAAGVTRGGPTMGHEAHAHAHSLFALNSDGSCVAESSSSSSGAIACHAKADGSLSNMFPHSRDSSSGHSGDWAHNSMDLDVSTALFDVFPPIMMTGSQVERNGGGDGVMTTLTSPSLTLTPTNALTPSSMPLSSLTSTSHTSSLSSTPRYFRHFSASHSSHGLLASGASTPELHTPSSGHSSAAAAASGSSSSVLSALLAQSNQPNVEGNIALQKKLESLFLMQSQSHAAPLVPQATACYPPVASDTDLSSDLSFATFPPPMQSIPMQSTAASSRVLASTDQHAVMQAAALASNASSFHVAQPARANDHSFVYATPLAASVCAVVPPEDAVVAATSPAPPPRARSKSSRRRSHADAFRCPLCSKTFTQKGGLQNHLRIHRNERPFACQVPGCTRAFAQKCNLTRHARCHTGEKPFKCDQCDRAFNRRWGLLVHAKSHAPATSTSTTTSPRPIVPKRAPPKRAIGKVATTIVRESAQHTSDDEDGTFVPVHSAGLSIPRASLPLLVPSSMSYVPVPPSSTRPHSPQLTRRLESLHTAASAFLKPIKSETNMRMHATSHEEHDHTDDTRMHMHVTRYRVATQHDEGTRGSHSARAHAAIE